MILTIDLGNSNPHVGVFNSPQSFELFTSHTFFRSSIWKKSCIEDFDIMASIVAAPKTHLIPLLENKIDLSKYKVNNYFFDMPFNYSESIGDDRLFQSFYLYKTLRVNEIKESVMLIDSGTFLTFDFIQPSGLAGGFIFPGIQSFLGIFQENPTLSPYSNDMTLKMSSAIDKVIPNTTKKAISKAFFIYLEAILEKMLSTILPSPPNKIILTGGQTAPLEEMFKRLDRSYRLSPHLIHHALHFICQTHKEGGIN